jgi:hypothetical protein
MRKRVPVFVVLSCLTIAPLLVWGQRNYQMRHSQQYEREMQDPTDDPPDAEVPGEWVFARLRYRSGYGRGFRGRSSWGVDSNRADRLFSVAMRRLTRVQTRSVEEVIDVDDGPMMDYPWLYAVEVGRWGISPEQGKRIREFLDRGGFLMVDDFHGEAEWQNFMEGLRQIIPDRPVVDLADDDPVFHIISDLKDKVQVPGAQYIWSGNTSERPDGAPAHWRGIYDEKGRLQVAICHNMDLGDAWQYADDPQYPEKFASLALRIGVNYVAYSMTH